MDRFEALSYAWGSTKTLIEVNAGPGTETISVTQNLATALPYLRYENTPRRLWIDAICVNQQDKDERSQQVQRMADVFRLAERVIVWLGPKDRKSGFAMETLRTLSSKIIVDWRLYEMEPSSSEEPDWADENTSIPYDEETLDAICNLLGRPWFERLWVRQEIHLANESALILCGDDSILWKQFINAIFCISFKAVGYKHASTLRRRLKLAFSMQDNGGYRGIGTKLREMANSKCSDPRDRVYAALSTLHESEHRIDITPDYTKTTKEVYTDLVKKHLALWSNLRILEYCELQEQPTDLPTWVPNWDVKPVAPWKLTLYKASGDSRSHTQFLRESDSILRVAGVRCGEIKDVHGIEIHDNYQSTVEAAMRKLTPAYMLNADTLYVRMSYYSIFSSLRC